jgi:hypothetical protein
MYNLKGNILKKTYKYLGYILVLLIPITFLAFYKTYFVQFPNFKENITTYTHLHAFISTMWILILILQPILIEKGKWKIHMVIGKITYVLFPILILSFIPLIISMYHSDHPKKIFLPLADSIMLILFYLLAIYNKKNVSKHMRFMIGITLVFLGPIIGRIGLLILELSPIVTQNLFYGIIYLILIGLIFYDKKFNGNYQPYILLLGIWITHQVVFNLIF